MSLSETLWWYLGTILEYTMQMLPCMLGALAVLAAIAVLNLTPKRRKDEAENG